MSFLRNKALEVIAHFKTQSDALIDHVDLGAQDLVDTVDDTVDELYVQVSGVAFGVVRLVVSTATQALRHMVGFAFGLAEIAVKLVLGDVPEAD